MKLIKRIPWTMKVTLKIWVFVIIIMALQNFFFEHEKSFEDILIYVVFGIVLSNLESIRDLKRGW